MAQKITIAALRNRSVFAALFAALIAVCCFVSIPAGPFGLVPIVLQDAMAVLAGAVLGPAAGAGALALFLAAGALGLPVFSGGTAGIARFIGPTGGFLVGYLAGAFITGLIAGLPRPGARRNLTAALRTSAAILAGTITLYIAGLLWLARYIMIHKELSFAESIPGALASGLIPFIPGAIIKLMVIIPLSLTLRPLAARYLNPDG